MMCAEATLWAEFHAWWLKCGIPVFVVRYEDLRETTQSTFESLIRWIDKKDSRLVADAETKDNRQTRLHSTSKIEQELSSSSPMSSATATTTVSSNPTVDISESSSPYKPRVGGLGKSLRRFDVQTYEQVRNNAGVNRLKSFGYDPGPNIGKNPNGPLEFENPVFPDMTKRPNYEGGKCELKGKGLKTVRLNDPKRPELRDSENKFGRYMTTFRRMHTNNDTEPLEVVSGEPYRDMEAVRLLELSSSSSPSTPTASSGP
jgi:hypothetical protein